MIPRPSTFTRIANGTPPFQRQSHEFLVDEGRGCLDDRTYFFYMATGITPAMTAPPVGSGSVYAMTAPRRRRRLPRRRQDLQGRAAGADSGEELLVLHCSTAARPAPSWKPTCAPAASTPRSRASTTNDDGTDSVYFMGPKAPEGWENNWVQTIPGKSSLNVMLRLYGPLEPWFDKTWMPGEIELVRQ